MFVSESQTDLDDAAVIDVLLNHEVFVFLLYKLHTAWSELTHRTYSLA